MLDPSESGIAALIRQRLTGICSQEEVAIPLAVESGSRAWGFPSTDSDFDCRFVFIRRSERYLSPWLRRDVIELPILDDLDINGWDLAKALRLLVKGNATIIEWLASPIAYRSDEQFRQDFLSLARDVADRNQLARHYFHLGEEQWRRHVSDPERAPLKKLFYALRPAAALRWLRINEAETIVPMDMRTLMADCDAPAEVVSAVHDLIAFKASNREMGVGRVPPPIASFIVSEFDHARESARPPATPARAAVEMAEDFFRRAVRDFDATG